MLACPWWIPSHMPTPRRFDRRQQRHRPGINRIATGMPADTDLLQQKLSLYFHVLKKLI